jgi:hypothetical protein
MASSLQQFAWARTSGLDPDSQSPDSKLTVPVNVLSSHRELRHITRVLDRHHAVRLADRTTPAGLESPKQGDSRRSQTYNLEPQFATATQQQRLCNAPFLHRKG